MTDAERISDFLFAAAWGLPCRDVVNVDRMAWRLWAENRSLFDRAGIGVGEIAQRLWDEIVEAGQWVAA